jgi:hypothetical protein
MGGSGRLTGNTEVIPKCLQSLVGFSVTSPRRMVEARQVTENPVLGSFRSYRRPMRCIILGRLWIAFMTPRLLSKSQVMSHKQQTTIFGIVFWTLLLASVGLVDRYQWLQPAWAVVCIGFLVVGAVSSTVDMYRNRVIRTEETAYLAG